MASSGHAVRGRLGSIDHDDAGAARTHAEDAGSQKVHRRSPHLKPDGGAGQQQLQEQQAECRHRHGDVEERGEEHSRDHPQGDRALRIAALFGYVEAVLEAVMYLRNNPDQAKLLLDGQFWLEEEENNGADKRAILEGKGRGRGRGC